MIGETLVEMGVFDPEQMEQVLQKYTQARPNGNRVEHAPSPVREARI